MNFYLLKPDCIGLDGHMSTSESGRPILHVVAELPADSDILLSGGCIIATAKFIEDAKKACLSGFSVEPCIVSLDDQFMVGYSDYYPLPELHRLLITGRPFEDDFSLSDRDYPIVSERVIQMLNGYRYNHSETEVLLGGNDAELAISHRRNSYIN
jgi:hypothetical protein